MVSVEAVPAMMPPPAVTTMIYRIDRIEILDGQAHARSRTEARRLGSIRRQRAGTNNCGCRGRNDGKFMHRLLLGFCHRVNKRFSPNHKLQLRPMNGR
jgi:hypothetical protein